MYIIETPSIPFAPRTAVRACDAQSATPSTVKKAHFSRENGVFGCFFIADAHHRPSL
jgi:hypothetical protein